MFDIIDSLCKKCLRCVQECKGRFFSRAINPEYLRLGDNYWQSDIIATTWYQAETGKVPLGGLEYQVGNSDGGFDKLRFKFPQEKVKNNIKTENISTSISLNRRNDNAHRMK